MNTYTIKASKRTALGKKSKALRKKGLLPANIYGKSIKSISIELDAKEFEKIYKAAGETGVIEIEVDKEKLPTLVHGLQKHPVTDQVIHADFLNVNLKENVTAQVPVELIGESPAVKAGLGTAVQQINEIEVEALPTDIPEKFVVDISILETVDQAIFIKDIKTEKKIEIKDDLEKIIVKVEPLRKEEEKVVEPVATPAEGETPVTTEEAAPEGEKKEETPAN